MDALMMSGDFLTICHRRAIWQAWNQPLTLKICTFSNIGDEWPLWSGAQKAVRVGSIHLPLHRFDEVDDLSFDEPSGRICVLISHRCDPRILILDII
jgi:hypothetical protein